MGNAEGKSSDCPVCRKPLKNADEPVRCHTPTFTDLVGVLRGACIYCGSIFQMKACQTHLKECLLKIVECGDCDWQGQRKDLDEHKRECRKARMLEFLRWWDQRRSNYTYKDHMHFLGCLTYAKHYDTDDLRHEKMHMILIRVVGPALIPPP